MDTVFTAAVSFSFGIIPGIAAALLTYVAIGMRDGVLTPFIICSIAEVLLICLLKPKLNSAALSAGIFAKLILLYIAAAFLISVMGGVIDYLYHSMWEMEKPYFSSEDTFKISLLRGGLPLLLVTIFSRIPINIVDRFIVVFGGFFISYGMKKIKKGNTFAGT